MDAPEDDLPLFGEITDVIAANVDQYHLVVSILNTISFNSHYHAYHVEYPVTSTHTLIQPSQLTDHHTLGLYNVNSCSFVSLKYHIIS